MCLNLVFLMQSVGALASTSVDHNKLVTNSKLKTLIRASGAKSPFNIMDLRVAH
jgi:hypothetical protein